MRRKPFLYLGIFALFTLGAVGLTQAIHLTYSSGKGADMPDLTEAGKLETRADGSTTFTHGHRYPDNTQIVTQHYAPDGQLQSAKVEWSGFAGKVMDLTATFDKQGNLVKEDGFRAEGMTTPVKALLKPLLSATAAAPTPPASNAPAAASQADATLADATTADAPVSVPSLEAKAAPPPATPAEDHSLAAGLKTIYGEQKHD